MNKKIKIPEIEQLSQQAKALYNAVNEESDLPCVLISTSYLDYCLASLLKGRFIFIFACLFYLHFKTKIRIYDINALQAKSIVVRLFEGLGKEPQVEEFDFPGAIKSIY